MAADIIQVNHDLLGKGQEKEKEKKKKKKRSEIGKMEFILGLTFFE